MSDTSIEQIVQSLIDLQKSYQQTQQQLLESIKLLDERVRELERRADDRQ